MNEQQKPKSAEALNPTVATKPNAVPQVPADWAALGAKAGYNPRVAKDLRLWIEGPIGEGKTTFNASIPKQLILDFEGGACAVVCGRAVPIHIQNYEHYMTVINKLLSESKEGKRQWDRICIDTADVWIEMIKLQLEKEKRDKGLDVEDITEFGQKGKGYNLIQNRCWGKIRELEGAGYTWTIIGHLRTKEETHPVTKQTVTRLRPSIYPGFAGRIKGNSDFCLTAYSTTTTIDKIAPKKLPDGRIIQAPAGKEDEQKYYIDTHNSNNKEGKFRGVTTMPRKIEVPEIGGWDIFVEHYETAVAVARKQYQ